MVTWRRAQMVLLSVQKLPHHPQQPTTLGDGGQPVLPPAPAGPGVDRPRPTWTRGALVDPDLTAIGRRWAAAVVATPPEKRDVNYLAMVTIAAILVLWLK